MAQALVLIDIQNDYFPGGAMELVGMDAAAAKARAVLDDFRKRGAPVVHIQHLSVRPGATFFVPGTHGVEHHASVAPASGEAVVQKNFPNSFRDSKLAEFLKQAGANELVIVGAMSHMCVDATTRAAFDFGYQCTVVQDACATRDLVFNGERIEAAKVHGSFMAALASPYAKIVAAGDLAG